VLHGSLLGAQTLADIQPYSAQSKPYTIPRITDPGSGRRDTISPQDLVVFKGKFPQLCEFSDEFLRDRTIDELLKLVTTSNSIKDAEKSRETEDRLSTNKANLIGKFFNVAAGRDNRCTELHPARFLPGAACSAARQFITARDVIGLTNPPPLSCYDMNSVGMGGFVQACGWLELGTNGSSKLMIAMFNLNNTARSGKSADPDSAPEMKTVEEFVLALRTLRAAAQFACNWNYSYVALENFFYHKGFMKDEL
jgi:hypothetical protein